MMGFWDGVTSVGRYANNLHLVPHQQHTASFLQVGHPSCRPTNSVGALKAFAIIYQISQK